MPTKAIRSLPAAIERPRRRTAVAAHLIALVLVAATPVVSAPALAFHDGGTANCEACHVMHDAVPGEVLMDGSTPLLTAGTASDVCLACHGGSGGVMSDNPLLPGPLHGAGDFVFLLEDNLNDAPSGQVDPIEGHAAGHSIISADYGLGADPRWSYAPGGSFPTGQLGCTSCHDPHGNTNFRMLNGAGEIQGGASVFLYDAPLADGLDITDEAATESRERHTAYRSGLSQWCSNCHGQYHRQGSGPGFHHPFDDGFEGQEITQYNRYEGTGSPTSGTWATAYLPEAPFEDPAATVTGTSGATTASRVMCLSCHRAHASSAPASGRWDFRVADLSEDGVVSGSYALPNPYGAGQGQLCAKCHVGSRRGLNFTRDP